jgi:hypothetical protein
VPRVLQFNFEDRDLIYLDKIKGADIVKLAIDIHSDTIVIFARDAWGRAYYDSEVARKTSRLRNRDLLREVIDEARKHGIRVIAMIGHTTHPELYSKHPEWAQRNIEGLVIHMDTNPRSEANAELRWPLMCLNSPFLDVVVRELEEVLNHGVDGVLLDSFRYMPDLERACYCGFCRKAHREDLGRDLPESEQWDTKAYRETFRWRYNVNVKAIEKLYRALKSKNPKAVLAYNSHPAGWKGRANTVVELARNSLDIIYAEASEVDYQPPGFLAEMVKLSTALSGGKPVWSTRNAFHTALTTTSTTPVAIRQGIREIFAAGGSPVVLVFSSTYMQSRYFINPVREAFREIEKLEEYMDGVSRLRYAAVVYSNRSRDWAGRSDPRHVTDEVRGFYYALAYNGIPVDFVTDHQLDDGLLSDYRVLILPYTASLSSRGVENIKRYSANHGIVATYLTSIMNEDGDILEDFQLSEEIGVSYRGLVKYPWSYIAINRDHPITRDVPDEIILWGDFDRIFRERRTPPSIAWHARVEPHGEARVLGFIGEPASDYGFEYENGRSPPLLGSLTRDPALIVKEPRAVYFTGQVGRLYWRLGLPHHEQLILNSILWSGGDPPIRGYSEGLFLLEPYKRNGQIIVHLLNLTCDRRVIARGNIDDQTAWHSTVETVMPPRRVIPIEVEIEIKELEPLKAWSPLTGRKLSIEKRNNSTIIRTGLGEYELIVLETK